MLTVFIPADDTDRPAKTAWYPAFVCRDGDTFFIGDDGLDDQLDAEASYATAEDAVEAAIEYPPLFDANELDGEPILVIFEAGDDDIRNYVERRQVIEMEILPLIAANV
jgi:hypothetical protein